VAAILNGQRVGIYNADYDLRLLRQTHALHGLRGSDPGMQPFCIMRLYSDYLGTTRFQSLAVAGRQLGIPLPNSHRALADTLLARRVHRRIAGISE
jgi:DNA polymerase III epsilon subunit-like protein